MDIKKISQLIKIGQLAIDLYKAEQATSHAKHEYHLAWKRYETGDENYGVEFDYYIHTEERIGKGHPDFYNACLATYAAYDFYRAQKRAAYNAKRRLQSACRNI